jgi:hypothetical protein
LSGKQNNDKSSGAEDSIHRLHFIWWFDLLVMVNIVFIVGGECIVVDALAFKSIPPPSNTKKWRIEIFRVITRALVLTY